MLYSERKTHHILCLCASNNQHLLLTILESGKFKIQALADLVLGESPYSLLVDGHLLSASSQMRGGGHVRATEQEIKFSGLFLEGH